MFNNRFGAAAQSGWNKVGLVIVVPASAGLAPKHGNDADGADGAGVGARTSAGAGADSDGAGADSVGKATTVVLSGEDSEASPRSQFLWGPSW